MRHSRTKTSFNVQLPGNICKGFEAGLARLIDELALQEGFKGEYLKEQYLTKYVSRDTAPADVRRSRAIEKWLGTERRNEATNFRVTYLGIVEQDLGWIEYNVLLAKIRRIIKHILGPVTYGVLDTGCHTNGASTRVKRSPKAAIDKVTGEAHGTTACMPHWALVTKYSVLEDQTCVTHEYSEMFTVPKSSDIDRVACKEPEINMFLQRSAGNRIRARLRRFGINLNDQNRNKSLAASAVKRGLATIDLSSASDSISRGLVFELLPPDWFHLLDDLRCKEVLIKDWPSKGVSTRHELQMFSSMGNGFTFELESLLFYAITRAVCWLSGIKGAVSVYGDDIIAPSAVVPRLKRVFDLFGFILNTKKTHFKGHFRESCGGHYSNGLDVTPFYLREPVSTVLDIIRVLNQLLDWDGRGWGFIASTEILSFHMKWAKAIPSFLWGGVDTDSDKALVTGHAPRKILSPIKKRMAFNDESALKHWLITGRLRDPDLAVEDPLVCDPVREVGYKVVTHRTYVGRTTWSPWLLAE